MVPPRFKTDHKRVIDVSAGICPLGPSRKVKAAIRKAIKEIGAPADGAVRRLEGLFSSKYGIPAEHIVFGSTLREVAGLLLAAEKPKRIIVAGGFPGLYCEDVAGVAAEVGFLDPADGFLLGTYPEDLVRCAQDTDMLIVSNPNRLTGRLLDEETFLRICGLAERGELFFVVDESLMEFTGREGIDSFSAGKRNIAVLRTTANYYGLPGLELAYAMSGPETIGEMRRRSCGMPNRLSVDAARTAFRDTAYRRQVKLLLAEEKRFLAREFGRTGSITFFDSDSNMYLLKCDDWSDERSASLLRDGFRVRVYRPQKGSDATLLGMSVMTHDKNVKLARLMKGPASLPTPAGAAEKDCRD
jgi:threonine-phosphate decarboxylase